MQTSMVRKVVAIGAALVALAVAFVAGAGSGASATQGQAVLAGQDNTETNGTLIQNTTETVPNCNNYPNRGLTACGRTGVLGFGTDSGVYGNGSLGVYGVGDRGVYGTGVTAGVIGSATGSGGIGVEGNFSSVGVWGHGGVVGVKGEGTENGVEAHGGTFGVFADGTDYGVYASAPNHGVYGVATTNAGAGLEAQAASAKGMGLRVSGKTQFSRSGTATIAGTASAPKSSVVLSNVALSGKSLVLTTAQKYVGGVWVAAAVPNVAAKTVTIYLNRTVTVSYPIAWFIVEKP
jgi:hypothetical protein